MKKLNLIGYLWFLLLFGGIFTGQSHGEDLGVRVMMYRCETKLIGVSNVDIFKQVLYDGDGNPVSSISSGFTAVFVAGKEIKIEAGEVARVAAAFSKMRDWKIEAAQSDEPVGMIEKQAEALVLFGDKWWVLKVYSGRVSIAKVEVVLEKDTVRIASLVPKEELMTSDSKDIFEIFEGVLADTEG